MENDNSLCQWAIHRGQMTDRHQYYYPKEHDHFYRYTRQCMQRIAFASYMHLPVSFSFRNFLTPQSQLLNTLRCLHNFYGPVASHVSARKKVNHKKVRGFLNVQENVRDTDIYYSTDGVGSQCSLKWFWNTSLFTAGWFYMDKSRSEIMRMFL